MNNPFKITKIKFVFLIDWLLVLLFFTFKGRITTINSYLLNLIPFIFYYIISSLLELYNSNTKKMFSVSYFLRFAFILICVDQLIKVYISIKFILNDRIYLLFNWLFFEPTINKKGSIFGSILSLDLGIWFYTITIFVVLIFFVQMIWFYKFRYRNSFWINISAIFIISGGVCALLDNILKGGSLDYIGINNLFIADLKDIYLSLGLACFLAEFIETKKVKRLLTLDLKRDLKLLREILFYSKRNIIDLFSQNMIEEENKNK